MIAATRAGPRVGIKVGGIGAVGHGMGWSKVGHCGAGILYRGGCLFYEPGHNGRQRNPSNPD